MIKLQEGQKVIAEDGSVYEIEKGDVLREGGISRKDIERFVDILYGLPSDVREVLGWWPSDYKGFVDALKTYDQDTVSTWIDNSKALDDLRWEWRDKRNLTSTDKSTKAVDKASTTKIVKFLKKIGFFPTFVDTHFKKVIDQVTKPEPSIFTTSGEYRN